MAHGSTRKGYAVSVRRQAANGYAGVEPPREEFHMPCTQCPRLCGAQRTKTSGSGLCRMPDQFVVARAALHQWEEPPISGQNGSGTVFFSGCSLNCLFCQNEAISQKDFGKAVSGEELRAICQALIAQGAHNINLVNPTHFSALLADFLATPLGVPVVWNTSGYERVETLKTLEGKVDIYLPDLKYLTSALAQRCSGAGNYPDFAPAAIREMARQTGRPVFDEQGLLKRGTVIRHLILPGHLAEAKAVMDWVGRTFPHGEVLFSLMSQYTPFGPAKETPGLDRTLRPSEVRAAEEYMVALGLPGFAQEGAAARESFIPAFDLTGIL